jgi:hypothetical protein
MLPTVTLMGVAVKSGTEFVLSLKVRTKYDAFAGLRTVALAEIVAPTPTVVSVRATGEPTAVLPVLSLYQVKYRHGVLPPTKPVHDKFLTDIVTLEIGLPVDKK